jgi:hypothetical protein
MTFYEWKQNNSGGVFFVNENLSNRVVIEADTYEQAEAKAFDFGIYYEGCRDGRDCDCCGDRWYEGHELTESCLEGKTLDEYLQWMADQYGWEDPDIIVHYADGTKKTFTGRK